MFLAETKKFTFQENALDSHQNQLCVSRSLSKKQAAKIMHICLVVIYPLEKKFIGTSSILARGKSRVLPTDPLFTHCICQVVTGTGVIFHSRSIL